MTTDPAFCVPGDMALRAAEIMRDENVGPVPVIASRDDRRVVGIVTDRDLTVRLIAEGRAPEATRVDEVMSASPVTCTESDDVRDALEAMSRNQVRRVPVVDEYGRLAGIIAQADVARFLDEEEVGEVVEDISQPGRSALGRTFRRATAGLEDWDASRRASGSGMLIAAGLGLAIGAALMGAIDAARKPSGKPNTGTR
ncbi:MAG TPA: CBS domain-containing protein [Bryobacteraceae bacterium]|nr:CBS domain-containing protein [Bryobacteraceae bacterium]